MSDPVEVDLEQVPVVARELSALATEISLPDDPTLRYCWELVKRAIEYHLLYSGELSALVDHLQHGRDYSSDEMLFEFVGGQLQVSFLDETVACLAGRMLALLQQLREHFASRRASA